MVENNRFQFRREGDRYRYRTVIFDDGDDYDRFVNYCYERFNGNGLDFSDSVLPFTVRVIGWLENQAQGLFPYRDLNDKDSERAKEILSKVKLWDISTIADDLAAGLPPRMRRKLEGK